jgi:hypothetical protein
MVHDPVREYSVVSFCQLDAQFSFERPRRLDERDCGGVKCSLKPPFEDSAGKARSWAKLKRIA